jgi:hypothetical protein
MEIELHGSEWAIISQLKELKEIFKNLETNGN